MTLKLLEQFKIVPTQQRIIVLNLILACEGNRFSAEDITSQSIDANTPLHRGVVSKTLRLFNVRGLIKTVDVRKTSKRGRPECLYQISLELGFSEKETSYLSAD